MRGIPLSIAQVLVWADQHHDRTGEYPNINSGPVPDTNETWGNLDAALRRGCRGFPRKISLANLLAVERGYRNKKALPHLTISQIVKWADAWKRKFGDYPKRDSGAIPGAPGETWARVNGALVRGLRGLRGDSSLSRVLAGYRGVRNEQDLPRLSVTRILGWIDAFHDQAGKWPKATSGPIAEGETWQAVDMALRNGLRGLPGGSSLAKLLADRRGVRNAKTLGRLTINGIWAWMVSHRIRTGDWPKRRSGRVWGTRWETWSGVASALERGRRGLRGGSSLQQLVVERLAGTQGGKEG
jgi:hypothetical protein